MLKIRGDTMRVWGSCMVCCYLGFISGVFSLPSQRVAREVTNGLSHNLTDFIQLVSGHGPVDFVVVLDRSAGIGAERFYVRERVVARHLISQYATLTSDAVRLSIITFAVDSTIVIDEINSESKPTTKCELFLPRTPEGVSLWDEKVRYIDDKEVTPGTNLRLALTQTSQTLSLGRSKRPGVTQVVVLLTDGDYTEDEDPVDAANVLKSSKAHIMALGIGSWLNPGSVRDLASRDDYYGGYDDWVKMLQDFPWAPEYSDREPLWQTQEDWVCGADACGPNSQCFCEIYSGQPACRCNPGYYKDPATQECTACPLGTYKSEHGDEKCSVCGEGYVTQQPASTYQTQCICPQGTTCTNACEPNPCLPNQICSSTSDGNVTCQCPEGLTGPECSENPDDCIGHECQNYGVCVDRLGDYACACQFGFEGPFCEININECDFDLCRNNATCRDGFNRFVCECPSGWKGSYCQDVDDDVTAVPVPTPPTPKTTTPEDPRNSASNGNLMQNEFMLTIIIPAVAGFLILLVIVVVIAAVCTVKRRQRKAKEEQDKVAMREERHYQKKFTPKTISQKFSGFWKKKTVRGNYWNEVVEGAPSAPPRRRPDLLSNSVTDVSEPIHNVDELYLDNQQISEPTGMEGWESYLKELESSNLIKRGCIARSDGSKSAKSAAFMIDYKELERLTLVLESGNTDNVVHVQQGEYHIRENDGTTAMGQSMSSIAEPEVLIFCRTKKFIIICIADLYSDDGKCLREVQWISDHIMSEGY